MRELSGRINFKPNKISRLAVKFDPETKNRLYPTLCFRLIDAGFPDEIIIVHVANIFTVQT